MKKYHKIQSVFKRDPQSKKFIEGVYSIPELEFLEDVEWVYTEKMDGMNIRVMSEEKRVTFGGKTDRAQLPAQLVGRLQERFLSNTKMQTMFNETPVCLYGEGYGAGIQTGGKYRSDQDFILFDVLIGHWWLQRKDVENVAKGLGLDVVPIIGLGTLSDIVAEVKDGITSVWGQFLAEGVVARPRVELKARSGNRIITKIKYKDFAR